VWRFDWFTAVVIHARSLAALVSTRGLRDDAFSEKSLESDNFRLVRATNHLTNQSSSHLI
jgi:hypothetical protein